ncbi:MAG: hypothetical protein WEA34_10550 [Gemmatimonadota bacterium]
MDDIEHHEPSPPNGDPEGAPLPRSHLPEPRPVAADAYWDHYARRVMDELEPMLAVRKKPAAGAVEESSPQSSWMTEIGDRWGVTALLAAASLAALLAVGIGERTAEPRSPSPDDMALALIAAGGDPTLLWERLGIPADPVLAWLTFDGVRP